MAKKMSSNHVSRFPPPRNGNANLKRRSRYSREDVGHQPPQKEARTQTQTRFGSANRDKVHLYNNNKNNNSLLRVSRRYDFNPPCVLDSYGRVSVPNVRSNVIQNHSPVVPVSSQSMITPNHRQNPPCNHLPDFATFTSETASFDSLPEWNPYPNEPTSKLQTGFVPKVPVYNYWNGPNSFTVPVRQNINSFPMTNVVRFQNPVTLNHGNTVSVPTQLMAQPNQSWADGNDLSELLDTFKNKGLVSLGDNMRKQNMETNKHSDESILGLDFDASLLKMRHESVINALYSDLPRQCTTCGLRFKCQEDHRNHMDWHVRKNRMAKNMNQNRNKKQVRKPQQSRKWFASASLWLSAATEESLDDKVIEQLFNGEEETRNKEEDEKEFVVPVDDDQKTCALCEEPFEDFFSDEADEWMYKGAVYFNMSKATTTAGATGKRSVLVPIAHVKCIPETAKVAMKDLRQVKAPFAVPSPGALVC